MKKIETKEQTERKNKRNQLFIGIILVGLMILSTGGYAIMNNENGSSSSIKYKGIKFFNNGGYWVFNYNNQQFATVYNPQETENISVNMNINLIKYNNQVLYFATEFGEPNTEILRNINPYIKRASGACLKSQNCSVNVPIKSCSTDNIIIIKEPLKNETESIYQEENCVFIKAYESNQTKFVDAFLFKLIGI